MYYVKARQDSKCIRFHTTSEVEHGLCPMFYSSVFKAYQTIEKCVDDLHDERATEICNIRKCLA